MIRAVGLMSGTSLDGIDAALLRTDGHLALERGPALTVPYDPAFRSRLRACLAEGRHRQVQVTEVASELTERHSRAVAALLSLANLGPGDVSVIGFHGHTIHHAPKRGETVQIGDGALLARLTGIDVVFDFRSRDVAAGGQGAPLVPVYHRALAAALEKPVAVLNIGGVANVTWVGNEDDDALLAFDTGPGGALLDDLVHRRAGLPFDAEGGLALVGKPDEAVLSRLLAHDYFSAMPPKSLDRQAFSADAVEGLALEDAAATLAAFTARAAAAAARHFPAPPTRWIVTGGNRRNPAILRMLQRLVDVPVAMAEDVGWNGDALEAEAFAYLAVRHLNGRPLTFPSTTGVPKAMVGGRFVPVDPRARLIGG